MIRSLNDFPPKVAVLMATYNGAQHISSQVASILWQVGVKVDIFIRDDGSSDGTLESVTSSFPNASMIKIIDAPANSGDVQRGAASNFFNLIASNQIYVEDYDWFALSDQDDIWLPTKLQISIKSCLEVGSVACSSSVLAFWSASGKATYIPKHGVRSNENFLFESPGPGCTFLIHSGAFGSLQSYVRANRRLLARVEFHDWFIYAYVSRMVGPWTISSHISMLYRQHDSNVAGAGISFSQLRKKLSLVYSGWYREQVLLLASIFDMDQHPAIVLLSRMGFWDRLRLPFVLWVHRRRLKDKLLLLLVLPFSLVRDSSTKAF
jgi:rhamnosyltransferase